MAEPPPLWRRVFDAVDHEVTPRLESLVRTPEYAQFAALVTRAQSGARARVGELSAGLWRLVNLPAGTDVARLRAQIGALDSEVRRLALQLEQDNRSPKPREEFPDADGARPAQPARRPGARPPRRRTQRDEGA